MSFSSQLSGSSGNSSLAWSMGNGGKGFVIIKFPLALDNGWYSEQPCTKFRTFQHRKERKGLKHEFVVLKLLDGSVCRVERMGDPDARFNALSPQGSTAQDLAQCFGLEELEAARLGYSDLITEVELPHEFDLMDVLKICRAIQEGEKTRNYTLQVYNCYFFALAIQVCLTRFIAYWEDHGQFTVWLSTVGNAVNALADPIQIIPPKFPTYYPTVFKLYSTLSSLGGQATFMLMKETKSKLQDQIEAQPDMSYRINNLLWHSAIDSSLNEFIEEMVKQGLIAIFRERASRTIASARLPRSLANLLPLAMANLMDLPDAKHPPKFRSPINNAPRFIRQRSLAADRFNAEKFPERKVDEMGYAPNPSVDQATTRVALTNWLIFIQGMRWVLNWRNILWALHHIASILCGVTILALKPELVPCTIVEDRLNTIINQLEGMPSITKSDRDRFLGEIQQLARNRGAIWNEGPWHSICQFIWKHVPRNLPELLEVGKPRLIVRFGDELRIITVSAFQEHALELIRRQANEVESFWLGSAASIQVELKETLSQVWKNIRDDESMNDLLRRIAGRTTDTEPFKDRTPDDLFRNVRDLTSTTKIIGTKPFAYGGYSDIWRGVEWGTGGARDVAIKNIRVNVRRILSLERLKKRISREIITWSAVVHQNIMPFYGLCWLSGRDELPAMVYPYCEAGTCSEYLANNPDADRMSIIRQVADGLHHLHSFDIPIAHGDIKAANILMKRDGTPLIADFGLSRVVMEFSTGLTTSSSRGSYRWMAPELFGGIDNHVIVLVSTASDVWAFGCLCLEILLGVLPWASTRSDAAIMLAVVKDRHQPPLPADILNTPIGHIVRHCWVYEPSDRPSMAELVNALLEIDPEHLHRQGCVYFRRAATAAASLTIAHLAATEHGTSPVQTPIRIPERPPVLVQEQHIELFP